MFKSKPYRSARIAREAAKMAALKTSRDASPVNPNLSRKAARKAAKAIR